MKKKSTYLLISFPVFLTMLFWGCTEDPRVDNLQKELAALKADVKKLENLRKFDQYFEDSDKIAFLTPGADGYTTLKFDLGVLTVSISDVIEYANGSKVTLQFGNPLSSTINGLNVKIEYGEVDEEGLPMNENQKMKEITFNEPLRSGSWSKVSVVLEGIPSTKLGFVRVREASHTGIVLTKQ